MKKNILLIAAICFIFSTHTANASLIGDDLTFTYLFPDSSTTYYRTDFTGGQITSFPGYFDIQTGSNYIDATNFLFNAAWTNSSFNGFMISGINDIIKSFTLSTNMPGLDISDIVFDQHSIGINWHGLSFNTGSYANITLNTEPIPTPEPASMVLMGIGLAGGALMRKRFRKSAV